MSYSEWEDQRLSEIVEITMGQSPKSEFYNQNKVGKPFLQGNRTFGLKYPSFDTWCTNPKKIAKKNDVLMSVRAPVGDLNIANKDLCIGRGLCSLRMKNENNEFLYYLLEANIKGIVNVETGSVFGSINKKTIESLKFKIPSIHEQKAIANILSSLDDKIELNNKINKNLEEMAQALYKQWFVDFEFPNEEGEPYKSSGGAMIDSELGLIPNGWEVGSIGDYLETSLGGTPSRKKQEYWNGNINWINSGKINDFRIVSESEKITDLGLSKSSTKLLPRKTTVLAITGATLGQTSLLEIDSCSNQSVIGILENDEVPYTYIFPMIQDKIDDLTSRQTGGAQQHINKNDVNSFKMIKPRSHILSDFHIIVSGIYDKIAVSLFENMSIAETRDILLPKLMSGEIEVPIKG